MDKTQLIAEIVAPISKKKADELSGMLVEQNFDFLQLIALSTHPQKEIGFRASWILEIIFKNHPEYLKQYEKTIVEHFPKVLNPSCQRHFCNIMKQILAQHKKTKSSQLYNSLNFEPVIECCFDWLINPKIAVAVKSCCCDILFYLSEDQDWIKEEMAQQLVFLMKTGSPAILSKGKKLLKKIG